MTEPKTIRKALVGERFHVVVIGGGINGVAIARECARAGRRTLLVEQHDFAAGTTSRSTRMIHGGLRYLEHGDIAQVRESLRERERLLRDSPNLVRPMDFLLALNEKSRRSALSVRAGLWLYRRMGAGRNQIPRAEDHEKFERLLDSGRRWSLFSFQDAQCEFPERLVAEWLTEAMVAGAEVRNHSQVLQVQLRQGRVQGVRLRDRLTGKEEQVGAAWVINATGPWVDTFCQAAGIAHSRSLIGGVRGSHIVVPRFAGALEAAIYAEAVDGRPIFVIPWNNQTLVGTTEVPDSGDPDRVEPTPQEINYLLDSVSSLFPRLKVGRQDIHYAFAGVRPLPFTPDAAPSAITRRHSLYDHTADGAAQMISIVGGKLTTAAQVARECVAKIGATPSNTPVVALASDASASTLLEEWVRKLSADSGIGEGTVRSIVEWHGKHSPAITSAASARPELRAPLCPHTEHIAAEAVHAFSNECAITLADVLLRRVPVALASCWSDSCSHHAGACIAAAMGWSERRSAEELEAFKAERSSFLRKPDAQSASSAQ